MPWTAAEALPTHPSHPKPWLPIPPEHRALAVEVQEQQSNSMLAFTRRMIARRNRHEALLHGTLQLLEAPDNLLAFERVAAEERLVCVFNLGTRTQAWRPPGANGCCIIERSGAGEGWELPPLSGLIAERGP
jgi:alpha-glucosidase